jgi:hypothetical protein
LVSGISQERHVHLITLWIFVENCTYYPSIRNNLYDAAVPYTDCQQCKP